MSKDIIEELDHHGLREVFLKYTRQAFAELPKMEKPYLLDIGCGYGSQTIEVSKLIDGDIMGIDIDTHALKDLQESHSISCLRSNVPTSHASLLARGRFCVNTIVSLPDPNSS